jgi:hypothetical protein
MSPVVRKSQALLDFARVTFVALAFLACAFNSPVSAVDNQVPLAIPPKTYVLILFLYDLNKNYHVLRAGTYVSADNCNKSGKNAASALMKGKEQNQNYLCLEADLPF